MKPQCDGIIMVLIVPILCLWLLSYSLSRAILLWFGMGCAAVLNPQAFVMQSGSRDIKSSFQSVSNTEENEV